MHVPWLSQLVKGAGRISRRAESFVEPEMPIERKGRDLGSERTLSFTSNSLARLASASRASS